MPITDTSILVEKYINTAYDVVKVVHDSIADINTIAANITDILELSDVGDLSVITANLAVFAANPPNGIKGPVVVSTTGDITLANEQTINTVAVVAGDRVLVRSQSSAPENGIYDVVDAGAWTRSSDWNDAADVDTGMLVMDGFTEVLYNCSFTGAFNPGTSSVTFVASASAFTSVISTTNTTASTSGSTGSIHTDGGIGALKDIVTTQTFKPLGTINVGDLSAFGRLATHGAQIIGTGSVNDVTLYETGGAIALRVPTGTQNVVMEGTVDNADGLLPFPAGTDMLFYQTAAPAGWTKNVDAALNDHALRIMTSGAWTGGTQGTTVFSTQFAQGFGGENYTLLTADMPAHVHSVPNLQILSVGSDSGSATRLNDSGSTNTDSTGGDGAHAHDVNLGVKYLDIIIASKD